MALPDDIGFKRAESVGLNKDGREISLGVAMWRQEKANHTDDSEVEK